VAKCNYLRDSFWGVVADRDGYVESPPKAFGQVCLSAPKSSARIYVHEAGRPHSLRPVLEGEETSGLGIVVKGNLYIGSDSDYGAETRVKPIVSREIACTIARLYRQYGLDALPLLEGNFALIIHIPDKRQLLLAVDKFGCNDIFYRIGKGSLVFGSHPALIAPAAVSLDALSLAFMLAQESFIPAPFTLIPEVRSLGRAHYLMIDYGGDVLTVTVEKYWKPQSNWRIKSRGEAICSFGAILEQSIDAGLGPRTALMLSGGVDSSLLLSMIAPRARGELVTTTWVTKGFSEDEAANAKAAKLAAEYSLPHLTVSADPASDTLPGEWDEATSSWMTGGRITMPLWTRLGSALRDRLGEGYHVLSGQAADTLADNNYTSATWGYWTRRTLFSSWFLRLLPTLGYLGGSANTGLRHACYQATNWTAGPRIAEMMRSLLNGFTSRKAFYSGRLFGYGEMPGIAQEYFPILSPAGFPKVTDWYYENFLESTIARLNPDNFYRSMIEMSMDMVMLHLDSRLIFHTFASNAGRTRLPFLDPRLVNFFGELPYSARSFYRSSKNILRSQPVLMRLLSQVPDNVQSGQNRNAEDAGVDEVMLRGSLGEHFRTMFNDLSFLALTPDFFDVVDESHFYSELNAFHRGDRPKDFRLINKVASLEHWARQLTMAPT
jgi:Asparagine synthase/Glutamine amidotransferase domain